MQYSGKLLPHRKICLKYFVPAHWSSAVQAHDLELQPGISDIQEWCAGSVLHCLSASTLHGFSPQGTGSHGNWDWRSQMCKFITKSISPRMTHCILVPSKWRDAFVTAFDSYPTALRIRAAWKAHLNLHECIVNKVFWILLLSADNSSFLPFTMCDKITHRKGEKKKAWRKHFLWFLFSSSKPVLKTYFKTASEELRRTKRLFIDRIKNRSV